ncbi:MAG: type VI secretion system tip protein TssI/VgrG [Polyangiaceae bacterium]
MPTLEIDGLSAPLRVVRYTGREAMSELFEIELHVVSEDAKLGLADTVGKAASFTFGPDPEAPRHLRGIVRRFEYLYHRGRHATFRAMVVPAAFRLTLRRDNRIFQGKSVPDILKAVLGGASIEDHTLALSGSYPAREYCVQYRETDWAFISRLMEEEGIFYFFEHGADATKLVIGDSPSVHNPIDGEASVKFHAGETAIGERIHLLHYGEELRPGKVTMRDYNFKTPALSLESAAAAGVDADLEIYDYPGNYGDPGEGSRLTERRLEAFQAPKKSGDGQSNCTRLAPGRKFTLDDGGAEIARDDLAQEYLVTRVEHEGQDSYEDGSQPASYGNRFHVVPASVPFRPAQKTLRPRIFGVQTAVVTGPGGEEIHTDEHGRIKVQFFWDRQGKSDENSSCWVRVKQPWAGPAWGHLFIPRIGQEVVIEFIEGDPDRPLCSGSVYHAANVPPYPLPAEKTKSTIKTESSVGGGGYNELRFEDLKGSEEIYLQAEKDWKILVKNDKSQTIGHDETLEVGNNQAIHVGADRTKTIDANQSETIGGTKDIKVGGTHTEAIDGDESITVGGSSRVQIGVTRSVTVTAAHDETIGLAQVSTVGGAWSKNVGAAAAINVVGTKTETVGMTSGESVGGNKSTEVGKNYAITVKKDFNTTVAENMNLKVKKDLKEEIDKKLTVVVGESITVKCGEAQIEIKKDGTIKVDGKNITVTGKGPIKVKGKKLDVTSDGAVNVKASGKVKVSGSKIDMN